MARTYGNKPVLSKVKIGEGYYYLKDADVRAILDAINDSVFEKLKLDLGSINDSNKQDGLAVVSDIKAYVDRVAELSFDAVKVEELPEANAANYLTYHNNIVLVPDGNKSGSCIEYIIIKNEDAYAWEQIGSSATDLVEYVKKATKIAGIDLENDITAAELQNALGLKALAYKASATGTVAGQTISGIKADFTPEGSISVTTAADGNIVTGGSIAVTVKDAAVASAATVSTAAYTPEGSVTVALKNNVISEVTDVGTLPSKAADKFVAPKLDTGFYTAGSAATWTGAAYTKPTLGAATKAAFAKEGIKAAVGTGEDAECLIFSAASTSDAVTAQGAFTQGNVDFGTFDGGSATVIDTTKFVPGSFTEGAFTKGTLPTVASKTVGVDSATFEGTEEAGVKVTGVSYVKQAIDTATFTATKANLSFAGTAGKASVGDIVVESKDVTVE